MQNAITLPLAAMLTASLASAQVSYGTDAASADSNFNLDIPTGISTGPLFTGSESWGMADDDAAGVYYANDGQFLSTAPLAGMGAAATLIGPIVELGGSGVNLTMTGLAFDNGVLYSHRNVNPEALHTIDLVTLEATPILVYSSSLIDLGGLDADPATGLIYASNDSAGYVDPNGNAGRGVVILDPVAGSESLDFPYPAGETDIDGLAFDPSGVIYLLEDEPAPLHNYNIAAMAFDPAPPMNSVAAPAVFSGGTFTGDSGPGGIGTAFCMTVPNSTGASGALSAAGTTMVASNDVTLVASSLPPSSFGFFIVSDMSGFVMNPGGSTGNLCLAGSIGRYVGPGQIQNSGSAGEFSLAIDLANIPQPTGSLSVSPGDTLFFQGWHRDTVGMTATSNLTNGLEITFN